MSNANMLLNPTNRAEQVIGVMNFYAPVITLGVGGNTPTSALYLTQVTKLALFMFMNGDTAGYRYEVIRRYLQDWGKRFDPNDTPLTFTDS